MRFALRSLSSLCFSLGIFLCLGTSAFAQASSTEAEPLILQMSDGRFYHPPSGTMAASRQEIIDRLEGRTPAVSSSTLPISGSVSEPAPPTPVAVTDDAPRLVLAARRGLALLQPYAQPIRTVTQKPSDWRKIILAVWDSQTDQIELIHLEKNGTSLRNIQPALPISVRGGLGYDTDYAITPNTKIVVGALYPGIDTLTQAKKTVYQLRDIVYVPYSRDLHTPEVVAWGKTVLDRLVNTALTDMRAANVSSHAFPGRLLADMADPVALKSIMAIEHMDHRSVGRGADDRLELFYIELGLNEGGAFRHEVSSAGANGLLQFIPSTYASMVKRWPQLKLIPDFHAGTADLSNAVKAQIAYLDDVWLDLPSQAKDPTVSSAEDKRAYLIAAYNTGGVRVRRAITRWGQEGWDDDYRQEWEKLDAKQTELGRAIFQLKKKVATEKNAATKKKLNAELTKVRAQHAKVTADLEGLDRSRLKAETLGYLYKYRLIAPRMKVVQVATL